MISDKDLDEIVPNSTACASSSVHIVSGLPIPKAMRVREFSPDDWEEFVEEWATSLNLAYKKVRRFGGSGDLGVDIAGFLTDQGFEGQWDSYQCKRYVHPLRPSDIWVEIGKIIYYSHCKEYVPPRMHFFVCSRGIGTKLEKLLSKPHALKKETSIKWEEYCRNGITTSAEIKLEGDLKSYFDDFDFSIFSSRSHVDMISDHEKTGYHAVRFGGGLPLRPDSEVPPDKPSSVESRYIRQLLDAYGDHLGVALSGAASLDTNDKLKGDFLRQRERFYHAESLRNFARDRVPVGTFESLQDEIYHGVVDVAEASHENGFERMKSTVVQASLVAATANPLASATKTQDRQGICHQLANENRLIWVPNDE